MKEICGVVIAYILLNSIIKRIEKAEAKALKKELNKHFNSLQSEVRATNAVVHDYTKRAMVILESSVKQQDSPNLSPA